MGTDCRCLDGANYEYQGCTEMDMEEIKAAYCSHAEFSNKVNFKAIKRLHMVRVF